MTDPDFRRVARCRVCGSDGLWMFLSLGETPLANALIRPERASESEARFPLEVLHCDVCGLVQLSVVVNPDVLFRHYLYASSASSPMLAHFDLYAEEVVDRFAPPGSRVVEIGSNDGVLLAPLAARGARVLGIEPSTNIARLANDRGLETWNDFFGAEVARRAVAEKGCAAAVIANNVLAHIDDLSGVLEGLDVLLADDGVFIAEVPYLGDLLENVEYDTIYHEHLSYFALRPLARLFARGGLELFDARRIAIHGGSVRIFAGRPGKHAITGELLTALGVEEDSRVLARSTFETFASRVLASRTALRGMLSDLRGGGARIAGLGATAKGNTLLNYCDIGPDQVEYIGDSTTLKQGLLTPGKHIPVRPDRVIFDDRPDYTLLLAWNYADAIVQRFGTYLASGGRFIHPIPLARLIPS